MKSTLFKNTVFILGLLGLLSCGGSDDSVLSSSYVSETFDENEVKFPQGTTQSDMELTPLEYIKWMQDDKNGLCKSKQIGDIVYQVQFKTPEYVSVIESDDLMNIDNNDSLLHNGQSEYYLDLKIKVNDFNKELLKYKLSSAEEYDARVKYLSFKVEEDIQLVDGKDTLPCSFCHFERAYDIVPEINIMLVFNTTQEYIENKTLIFHDRLFNNGIIKLVFASKDIGRIPKLKHLQVNNH